jgi:iron complex outermembrane receptor protein
MLHRYALLCCICAFAQAYAFGQDDIGDSLSLGQVIVRGFETGRTVLQVPASVTKLSARDIHRYTGVSLVPAISTVPGVRMEERSPGSYRLSIRGSLLRSPFGIRNIKVYMDDFVLTDAGGNTYLNLLDLDAVGSVEIIRGPASSLYGTGTGGVVQVGAPLMPHAEDRQNVVDAQLSGGSFGLFTESLRWQQHGKKVQWQVNQGHLQSDGYRENSRMRRDAVQVNMASNTSARNRLQGLFLFSDLDYRTPGGLTLAQAQANPRQARPATPATPGAAEQLAGIRNSSALAGLSDTYQISGQWHWTNALTVMYTDFENPFITNYETRKEWNLGLRSVIRYQSPQGRMPLSWVSGIEWQRGWYRIDSTGNTGGQPSGPMVEDKVGARQQFAFTQVEISPLDRLVIQAGISLNDFRYTLERVEGDPAAGEVPLDYNLMAAPRLALLYRLTDGLSLHGSIARGFSPPSIAEVRPSAGGFDTDLQAEYGWSVEAGLKGSAWRGRLHGEITAFRFDLKDAIVRRTNAAGAEFFVNAGGTKQEGIEAFVEGYLLPADAKGWLTQVRAWTSVTLNRFRFADYQSGTNDFSGNRLTGVPAKGVVAGLDVRLFRRLTLMGTFQYTDPIPLTDANDVFAEAWRLWTARAEWKTRYRKGHIVVFAAVDNIGNAFYSLGNDLNAFGRRYYNPAATRNFAGGIRINWMNGKRK